MDFYVDLARRDLKFKRKSKCVLHNNHTAPYCKDRFNARDPGICELIRTNNNNFSDCSSDETTRKNRHLNISRRFQRTSINDSNEFYRTFNECLKLEDDLNNLQLISHDGVMSKKERKVFNGGHLKDCEKNKLTDVSENTENMVTPEKGSNNLSSNFRGNHIYYEEYSVSVSENNFSSFESYRSKIFECKEGDQYPSTFENKLNNELVEYSSSNCSFHDDDIHCDFQCDSHLKQTGMEDLRGNEETVDKPQSRPSVTNSDVEELFVDAFEFTKNSSWDCIDKDSDSIDLKLEVDSSKKARVTSEHNSNKKPLYDRTIDNVDVPYDDSFMTSCSENNVNLNTPINEVPWKEIFPVFKIQMYYPHREIWWASAALIYSCKNDPVVLSIFKESSDENQSLDVN